MRPRIEDGKRACPSSRSGRYPPWRSVWSSRRLGISYPAHSRQWELGTINNVFDAVNTGFNLLVLLAGALWFCVTLEAWIKRKEALGFAIGELGEFSAYVIDVTQLYYTPDLYRPRNDARPANPAIDETYLLYCTQMLGVISNLAAVHARGDRRLDLGAVASEVQMLAMAIATKHLAKAEAARRMNRELPTSGAEPVGVD